MMIQTQAWVVPWLSSLSSSVFACLLSLAVAPVVTAACTIAWWRRNNWRRHPFSKCLRLFVDTPHANHPDSWIAVAMEINIQYRRVDKLSTRTSSTTQLVATDSWLLQVGPYSMAAIPLADTLVVIEGAINNTLDTRVSRAGNPQLLKLRTRCVTKKTGDITFRLSSNLLSELERKLVIPILNTGQVVVQKSLADQFLEVFVKTVNQNPPVTDTLQDGSADSCIGCMTEIANVKLERRCEMVEVVGERAPGRCLACSCRPMWCLTCMSKWFAARQDQNEPETWLSSRAPCPTCRSPFCLLDVRILTPKSGSSAAAS
uniref:Transmembrane protein 129-like isoform X1 n=1 Tax=Hirondellea gigas TaxID=1518452 RepID=A0A6A7FT96_9CRUS